MTDLVIYYTRTNKTKQTAEIIAKLKDAEILEVKDLKNRKGAIQYMVGALDSLRNKKTKISYDEVNLAGYDTIYIGTPVWASKPAPAIVEFINENDFSNASVVTFATMMANGGEKTTKAMNDSIRKQGGNILKSFSIISKNTDIEEITKEAIGSL